MTSENIVIPIGPQHPALKEPGHFEFKVDGEIVVDAHVRLGYAHRAIEKTAESRNWTQNLYLMERICGICSHVHAMTYIQGVEQLAEVIAPPRAQAIRVLFAELERIHSHLLWLGVTAHEAGFDTLFMYAWRDREQVMNLFESITGSRVTHSINTPGGVKVDLEEKHHEAIHAAMDLLDERMTYYLNFVRSDRAWLLRTRGVGQITAAQAEDLGVTGPMIRACGIPRDIRSDAPYSAYNEFSVYPVIETAGDLEARVVVRVREMQESIRLVRSLLQNLPAGELEVRVPRRIKAGETISRAEAPRGELFYFIESSGADSPQRIKVRTPSLPNIAAVMTLALGQPLADVPMILAGVDPCFSCNDRMVVINEQAWSWKHLRQYAIDWYGRQT